MPQYRLPARPPSERPRETAILDIATQRTRTTLIESWQDAPGLPAAWDLLLSRCGHASVFQTMRWQLCWWRAFGASHDLRLVLAWSGSRLVGIAPMMRRKAQGPLGGARTALHFIGSTNHAADYCDFIVDPEYPQALDSLLDEICRLDCDRIDLSHLPGHSPHRERIEARLKSAGLKVAAGVQEQAPVRLLGDAKQDRKAANKTSLKRNKRYFEKLGRLGFRTVTDVAEALDLLPAFFDQHRRRWAQTDWPSLFLDPLQRKFYRDMVRELLPQGELVFDIVELDGRPLAFHLGFCYRGSFIWYKPTFDIRHARKSPGQVLIKFLLERAIADKLREFDFTIGAEGFKHRFANRIRYIDRVVGFRSVADFWRYRTRQELKKRFGENGG